MAIADSTATASIITVHATTTRSSGTQSRIHKSVPRHSALIGRWPTAPDTAPVQSERTHTVVHP